MSSSIIKSDLIASFLNTYQLVEQDRNLTMTILHIKPPNQNSYNHKHIGRDFFFCVGWDGVSHQFKSVGAEISFSDTKIIKDTIELEIFMMFRL